MDDKVGAFASNVRMSKLHNAPTVAERAAEYDTAVDAIVQAMR